MASSSDSRSVSVVRELEDALAREVALRRRAEALLRAQYSITDAMAAVGEPELVFGRILDAVLEAGGLDCGGIYTRDTDGGLRLFIHRGLTQSFLDAASHYPAGSANVRIAEAGLPVYADYRRLMPPLGSSPLASEGLRAIAIIPIVVDGRMEALLNLASHVEPTVAEELRPLVEAVGAQAAKVVALMTSHRVLHERERDLDSLFETAQDFLFVLDEQGRILRTNRVVQERLGYGADELQNMDVDAVHPEDRRDEARRIVAAMLRGELTTCPVPLRAKSGALIPVETRVRAGRWQGRPALLGISRDVSEREQAAAALRAERDFAQLVMRTVEQGLTVTDADGRFEYVNPAYARMAQRAPSEMIGRSPAEFTVEDDRARLEEARQARREGRATTYETRLLRADGGLVPVLITGAPRWPGAEVSGAISVVTDLTEQKQHEETRLELERQIQEAQRRSSLGLMAGGVAHHFNNLLTAVLGNIELAIADAHGDEAIVRLLQEAARAGRRAGDISRMMLTYVGQHVSQDARVSLAEAVDRILRPVLTVAPPNICVALSLPTPGPIVGMATDELKQVVGNLLSNAFEAVGKAEGTVTIAVTRIEAGEGRALLAGDAVACLEVSDTGHGMERDVQARMFDPFFTTRMTGRGLGLAVTLGIVQARRGTITVESAPGSGTTIRVLLPLVDEGTRAD
jgi:PAS domain S-box-containing protein